MRILKGSTVTYTDHAGMTQMGAVDRTSISTGRKLYRVHDRWLVREVLSSLGEWQR